MSKEMRWIIVGAIVVYFGFFHKGEIETPTEQYVIRIFKK